MKLKYCLFIISVISIAISCRVVNEDKNKITNHDLSISEKSTDKILFTDTIPDSIAVEKYLSWINSIDYIEGSDHNIEIISKIETSRDTTLLWQFLNNYKDSLPILYFFDPYYFGYVSQKPLEYIYSVDINNDGVLDVIYHGPSGGTPFLTQIYLNTEKGFNKIFSGLQHVIDFEYRDNTLLSFTLFNPGCCLDPQIATHYYSLEITENSISYDLDSTVGYLTATEKPEIVFQKTQSFKTNSDNSKLRSECYFFDKAYLKIRPWNYHGNIIAEYSKGTNGKCLGSKTVNEEEWVFVIMDPVKKSDSCYFSYFTDQPTMIKGWMLKSDTNL
jgi:hypothetical protein